MNRSMRYLLSALLLLGLGQYPAFSQHLADQFIVSRPEVPAALPGCLEMPDMYRDNCNQRQLRDLIAKYLTYPPDALKDGIEGEVQIGVIIDTAGMMQQIRLIQRASDHRLNEAAMQFVHKLKSLDQPWKPALMGPRIVTSEYVLSVPFLIDRPETRPTLQHAIDQR